MGKSGIPMTTLMQGELTPTFGAAQPMDSMPENYNGTWGSLYYENGKATMTASAFDIKRNNGEI